MIMTPVALIQHDFYSASSQKQKPADRRVAPLMHIFRIASQPAA